MIIVLFNNIVLMAKQSIIAFFVILIVRLFINKKSKKYSYFLWLLFFAKLIIPYFATCSFSIYRFSNFINTEKFISLSSINEEGIKYNLDTFLNITDKNNLFIYVWLIGMIIFCLFLLFNYISLRRKVRFAIKHERFINVKVSDKISIPFVWGIIKPVIYIPQFVDSKIEDYIFIHESIHISKKDYLIKTLTTILLVIYWFNPFVWFAYHQIDNDMEMSCDECVILKYNIDRKQYANSLLSFYNNKNLFCTGFTQGNLRQRIINILNCKKAKGSSLITFCFIVLFVLITLFTKNGIYTKYIEITSDDLAIQSPIKNGNIVLNVEEYTDHKGIDILGNDYYMSSEVYPCCEGIVSKIGDNELGEYIIINHDNHFQSIYYGLTNIRVSEQDVVFNSSCIGDINTLVTNKALHFELKNNKNEYVKNIAKLIEQ